MKREKNIVSTLSIFLALTILLPHPNARAAGGDWRTLELYHGKAALQSIRLEQNAVIFSGTAPPAGQIYFLLILTGPGGSEA